MSTVTARPSVVPPTPFVFPTPDRRTLANGLEVVAYEVPGQYVHAVRVAMPHPLVDEPPSIEGVGSLMARALDEGTENHTATDFARHLDRRGISFGAGLGDAGLAIDLDMAKRNLAYGLDCAREALTRPVFDEREVARLVRQRLAEIEQERAVASHRAGRSLLAAYYDLGDRMSRPTGGSRESVARITRDDVVAFHCRRNTPVGASVVIAGDFEGLDPFAQVEAAFGDWVPSPGVVAGAARTLRSAATAAADRVRVVMVDRPGSVQTETMLVCPGPDRDVAGGWAAYPVLSFIVGGSPNARLDSVLREDKGYTYGVRAGFRPRPGGGTFVAGGSVRADATVDAVRLMVSILDDARGGFTADELRQGVDFIARTAPNRYATAESVADEASALAMDGLTTQRITDVLAALGELDVDRLGEAYRAFIDGRWTVVLVGDAAAHRAGIESLGLGPVSVVPN